jgi:hypothetical protein
LPCGRLAQWRGYPIGPFDCLAFESFGQKYKIDTPTVSAIFRDPQKTEVGLV